MREIEFHREAEEEMRAASRYYEQRVEGLGERFLDAVEDGLDQIKRSPLSWSVYEGEYRRYSLKRFPYGLIYYVEGESIFIVAVAHLHRKPGYWKSRRG